jgi:hypothetical protein
MSQSVGRKWGWKLAEKRNLFPSAAKALGNQTRPQEPATTARAVAAPVVQPPDEPFIEVAPADAPLPRFAVVSRQGRFWSYPYAAVGLIECPSQERVLIHCTCGTVKTIEIHGRGLRSIAESLTAGRLQTIFETDNAKFAREATVVTEVVITSNTGSALMPC